MEKRLFSVHFRIAGLNLDYTGWNHFRVFFHFSWHVHALVNRCVNGINELKWVETDFPKKIRLLGCSYKLCQEVNNGFYQGLWHCHWMTHGNNVTFYSKFSNLLIYLFFVIFKNSTDTNTLWNICNILYTDQYKDIKYEFDENVS